MNIPPRYVSGSEVIYGPVGLATQTIGGSGVTLFDGAKTQMSIYHDTEFIPKHTFQKVVESGPLLPQPSVYFGPNRGAYRYEFTGDIGVFKDDYIHFRILNQELAQFQPAGPEHEQSIILSWRYMKSININTYYDGRLQPPAYKQSEIGLDALPGTAYLNPLTRVYSMVLKGNKLTSVKQVSERRARGGG